MPHKTKTITSLILATLGVFSAGLAMGCAPQREHGAPLSPGKSNKAACNDDVPPAPKMAELRKPSYPRSNLRLMLDVPTEDAVARISREVPVVLAREKDRPVGAPGRASFVVRRGPIRLDLTDDQLGVNVAISADISVCKPIGGMCLRYGSCSPAFDTHFGLDAEVPRDYAIQPPKGSLWATKKCVIGLDVTPQLETIARQELQRVSSQVKAQWPDTRSYVERAWRELGRPLRVTPMDCVLFDGKQISYSAPRFKKDGALLFAELGIAGELRPAPSCSVDHEASPLPAPTAQERPGKQSALWIPEIIGREELEAGLARRFSGRFGSSPEDTLDFVELRLGGSGLSLLLSVRGRLCRSFWVRARLVHGPDRGLLLDVDPDSFDAPAPLKEQIIAHLEEEPVQATQGEVWTEPARVTALLDQLHESTPPGVQLRMGVQDPKPARVQVTTLGIVVLHSVRAQLSVIGL